MIFLNNKSKKIIAAVALAALLFGGILYLVQKSNFAIIGGADFWKKLQEIVRDLLPVRAPKDFSILWLTDFNNDRLIGLSPEGKIIWEQGMTASPIPAASFNVHTEYVTLAPNGNLIVADGDGMMVQEIDRATHALLWQYGQRSRQGSSDGRIDQPDKSYKINDHEVLINDGNNRRVIIVDQRTNQIVWQYGHTLEMSTADGYLEGNTSCRPLEGGEQIIITDTLQKKIFIVDRASKKIVWQYEKPDAKWLEHVFPADGGNFVLEDRQKNEVFEINREGKIIWLLNHLADGSELKYPTDTVKLANGDVLIADSGRGRVIEVVPQSGVIERQWGGKAGPNLGLVTTLALDFGSLPAGNQMILGKSFVFVGPRANAASSTPGDYGFWSFAMPVPGVLSRSGQPTLVDFQWLKQKGWRSVVDLRVDGERGEVGDDQKIPGFSDLGFKYLALPINDGSPPSNEQAEKFLAFVTDPQNQPVHVHCRGGIGRAGIMVALYRYSVQGWPWLTAVDESKLFQGGISEAQRDWFERWAQNHAPGSFAR